MNSLTSVDPLYRWTATCGEVGARLSERLALPTSPTTLLRRIMALPTDAGGLVVHLGVNDFAFRRRRTYGTDLVDVVRHRVIDLLDVKRYYFMVFL